MANHPQTVQRGDVDGWVGNKCSPTQVGIRKRAVHLFANRVEQQGLDIAACRVGLVTWVPGALEAGHESLDFQFSLAGSDGIPPMLASHTELQEVLHGISSAFIKSIQECAGIRTLYSLFPSDNNMDGWPLPRQHCTYTPLCPLFTLGNRMAASLGARVALSRPVLRGNRVLVGRQHFSLLQCVS